MRRAPFFPGNATTEDVEATGPDIVPDSESTGKPRPGFGARPNETAGIPTKATKAQVGRINSEVATEFDSGQGYDILRVREQTARSYNGRTLVIPAGSVVQLVGDDAERVRLVVKVNGAGTDPAALVGALTDLSGNDGYTIYPGQSLETTVRSAIYVASGSATDSVSVSLWMERDA